MLYVTRFLVNSCSRKKKLIEGRQAERKKNKQTGRRHTGWSRADDEELGGQSEIQVSRRREKKEVRSLRMGERV